MLKELLTKQMKYHLSSKLTEYLFQRQIMSISFSGKFE